MSLATTYDLKNVVSDNRLVGLWRMLTGYQLRYIMAVITVGFSAVARTAVYFLLAYFVDDVLPNEENLWQLPWVALGFILLAVVQGGFSFLSGKLAAETSEGVARRLRNFLYDQLQRFTFTYHDKTTTGEMIQRSTSDVDALRRFYSEQAIGLGRIIMLFLINFIAIAMINVQLALISVILVPVIIVMSIFFFKKVSVAYESFQEQDAKLSTTLQENLSGVRVVKAFARQPYEEAKFEGDNMEKYRRGKRLVLMHTTYWPISDIISGFQMLLGFVVGALMAINGTITLGEYLAVSGFIIWIIWPVRNMGRLVVQMSTGMVSFERVLKIISHEREPLFEHTYQPDGPATGDIVFDDVSFAYDGEEQAVLHNISFHCRPGERVALLGSTGSGKTSLVSLLPRFYEYTGGSIKLDGVELKDYSRAFLRSQIGIVEQEPFLFSRTIRENITYGVNREVSDEEVERVARAAAIHDSITGFPEGYSTLVGERGVTLSGGQKQRVTIARTLLKDANILILDDAVSAVDMETEATIRGAMDTLMANRTTFIIAHRIQSVMHADHILVLDAGRVVQHGTHAELLAESGPYRRIYDLQARIEDELEEDIASVGSGHGNGHLNGREDGHSNGRE